MLRDLITFGLHKRLSTKRSLTLKGILITDSYKQHLKFLRLPYLNPCYKLCPHKLRLYKLRPASKLDKNLRSKNLRKNLYSNVRKNFWKNLRKNLYRQPQGIKHLKFLKLPYLNLCL